MGSGLRLAAIVVAASTLVGAPARADTILLTGGVLDLVLSSGGSAIGPVQLTGDRGFTFAGSMAGGFTQPIGDPLIPGTTVTLRGSAAGLDLGGTATLDGVTYTGVGGLDSTAGASLLFVTTATLPSILNPPSSVTAPFALDFLFSVSGQESHALFGSGTATIFLGEDLGFGVPSWRVTGIRAEVSSAPAPIPEPATLFLAASGLAWGAIRRRRTSVRGD